MKRQPASQTTLADFFTANKENQAQALQMLGHRPKRSSPYLPGERHRMWPEWWWDGARFIKAPDGIPKADK